MAGEGIGEWSLYWTSRGRPVPARLVPVLAGWAGLDEREDAAPEERKHLRQVYGDPWVLVRDLLGHSSEQTTRLVYLPPWTGPGSFSTTRVTRPGARHLEIPRETRAESVLSPRGHAGR